MKALHAIAWMLATAATAAAWSSSSPAGRGDDLDGVTIRRDLVYRRAAGGPLRLDLMEPERPADVGPLPILVAVHGGSWTGGSKRMYGPQFAPLARSGIAVAVVDYRPARPGAPSWREALDDVIAAVDWLERHAESLGLDPARIAAIGTSSGGLLALLAAQEDARIAAAVGLSTPTSLRELAEDRHQVHEPSAVFLGVDPRIDPGLAGAASPRERVRPGGPGLLLIHGDDDRWVPIDQARRMLAVLERVDATSRLVEISGARHGFELKVQAPSPQDLAPLVREFLEENWANGLRRTPEAVLRRERTPFLDFVLLDTCNRRVRVER